MVQPACILKKSSAVPAAKAAAASTATTAAFAAAASGAGAAADAVYAGAQWVGLAAVAFAARHAKVVVQLEGGAFVAARLRFACGARRIGRARWALALATALRAAGRLLARWGLRVAAAAALARACTAAATAKTVAALAGARLVRARARG